MDVIAKALVMAVQYIADRDEGYTEDDDLRVLESLSALLLESTEVETKAMERAARDLGLPDWLEQLGLQNE